MPAWERGYTVIPELCTYVITSAFRGKVTDSLCGGSGILNVEGESPDTGTCSLIPVS